MSNRIGYWHVRSGDSLVLHLFPLTGGGPVTPEEGVILEEADDQAAPGYYEGNVEDLPTGSFRARVFRETALIFDGVLEYSGTSSVSVVGVPALTSTTAAVASFLPSALSQLLPYRSIGLAIPAMAGGTLTPPLIQGDSYLADHGRQIAFSREDFPEIPADSLVKLRARHLEDAASTIELDGEIAVSAGTTVAQFEVTSTESSLWSAGQYAFRVEIQFPDGNSATFIGPETRLRVAAQF